MSHYSAQDDYRSLFVGTETQVPLLNGGKTRYVNFDNAASTPPLKAVQQAVNDFLPYYSSVHRGTGFKSQLSTHLYEEARRITLEFLGADPEVHTCIFGCFFDTNITRQNYSIGNTDSKFFCNRL